MRARNIKPSLFKNELLGAANPVYTLTFIGLWCAADREGRLEDRPLRIHAEINPYRPRASTEQALDWLEANLFLVRYEHGGQRFIQIANFTRHQHPHHRESDSEIPAPQIHGVAQDPVKVGAGPGLAPGKASASPSAARLIPDSGFLIPDSGYLIPDPGPPESRAHVPCETKPASETEIFERIEAIKAKYPPGAGRVNWIEAERTIRRIIDDGLSTWPAMLAGVERYAAHVKATGRQILNPANFFGAEDRPYSQQWPIPARRGPQTGDPEATAAFARLVAADGANRTPRDQTAIDAIGGWSAWKARTPMTQAKIRADFLRAWTEAAS